MEDDDLSVRDVVGKDQRDVSGLEAGMRSQKNKAGGKGNAGRNAGGEVQTESGNEDAMVKNGPGAPQGAERGAHAGTGTIDSIDWV